MRTRILGAVLASVVVSCAGPEGPAGPTGPSGADGANGTNGATSLVSMTSEPAGAHCANGGQRLDTGLDDGAGGGVAGDGTLQPGEVDATAYVCSGSNGATSLVSSSPEAPGTHCASGGLRIDSGLDDGAGGGTAGDGMLQAGEVDTTAYVCAGVEGFASLVDVMDEPAGANCASGGKKLESGLDDGAGGGTARDGVLQAGEVDHTAYVCGAADGFSALLAISDEPAGANCASGGKKLESGLDDGHGGGTARDGVLQAGEVDHVDYACACVPMSVTLSATQSTSVSYPTGGAYDDDTTRAYSNPGGNCLGLTPCDLTGWYAFDTTPIPAGASILSMRLDAFLNFVSGAAALQVFTSTGNAWTRSGATAAGLPRTAAVSAVTTPTSSGAFLSFPLDTGGAWWTADLVDHWMSLGIDNTNTDYTYAYFAGSDSANRALLHVTYCH